ncbi:AsmA family protein [Aquimarina sp. ERC-38]|uniref:AsmA family protein n=1 Tax=Aquimarina sp. ERC-38 TaxID=2949996 RepID=UPI00224503F7|nr:AsmA-like C-terminal region-containing protein [Aquimarina sp. ERC-38]UZO81164.1 AsmA family protein [Aquimarina sp. ERC-38]
MKKIVKVTGIVLLVLLVLLIALPYFFSGTIKEKVKTLVNQNVNAIVNFEDVDISVFRNFPNASVVIDDLVLINKIPFEGDTLANVEQIFLTMGVSELFKGTSEPMEVQKIIVDKAQIHIKVDSLGQANYDIGKESTTPTQETTTSEGFSLNLDHYEINKSNLIYDDRATKTFIALNNFNHQGDGTVSGNTILLNTHTDTKISFNFDQTNYLTNNDLLLNAIIELDLENQKYTFKENEAKVNQLPLTFDGYVQLSEAYTDVNINFKTPSSDFRNFLGVIPETYAKNIENVKTTGNFEVDGKIYGKVDDTYIPKLNINIKAANASFKYPDLPRSVENITINALLANDTGLVKDTYATIDNFTFRIAEDTFAGNGSFKNLTENILVALQVNGTLNLENLEKAYPLILEQKLKGKVKANLTTNFDMNSLEKEQYQKVKSAGNITLTDFAYASPEIPNEVAIKEASVNFEPGVIRLEKMTATTGASDMTATGTIENMLGFLFTDQQLKGNFNVTSTTFNVNDFMIVSTDEATESQTKSTTNLPEGSLKVPSFLDATLNFKADKVVYDNLNLSNTKGSVVVKDETALLKNITAGIFNGSIAFDGLVNTKETTPTFKMALDLSKIDITQSFSQMELLQSLAPIAKALTGILNTKLNVNGKLNNDLTPVLQSIKGSAIAELLNAKVNEDASPLLSSLDSKLSFINLKDLNLKDIKTNLDFNDGRINVKPFTFNLKGVKINASGSHSFTNQMDYKLVMDVPATYFGSEISGLVANLNKSDLENTIVPLPIGLSGTFSNPAIKVNPTTAIKELTQQLISKQKSAIKEKVGNQIKEKTSNVLKDLIGNTKEQKGDTTAQNKKESTEDKLKDAAKNVLGGFLNRKKKKDSTK